MPSEARQLPKEVKSQKTVLLFHSPYNPSWPLPTSKVGPWPVKTPSSPRVSPFTFDCPFFPFISPVLLHFCRFFVARYNGIFFWIFCTTDLFDSVPVTRFPNLLHWFSCRHAGDYGPLPMLVPSVLRRPHRRLLVVGHRPRWCLTQGWEVEDVQWASLISILLLYFHLFIFSCVYFGRSVTIAFILDSCV